MLYVNPLLYATPAQAEPGSAREKQVLQEFEHLFLYQLLREMRKSVPKSELFPKSSQQSYFEEMLDDVLAGAMARSGQLGIAAQMQAQLAQRASATPTPAAPSRDFLLHDSSKAAGLPIRSTLAAHRLVDAAL